MSSIKRGKALSSGGGTPHKRHETDIIDGSDALSAGHPDSDQAAGGPDDLGQQTPEQDENTESPDAPPAGI